ncbi:hypothetical protein MKK69_14090 [Methylobacterium sp. J-026]|uniref:hypothetical protein n=1 Tax=Methylobacterium sp. J-026 TaxID=2836624 RepID=UPI001FB95D92|nr:hypothetical protein [Methylobacterium sp. J-026]MCJ2135171.1 hypothetical protein [Methylobacterium sp. J-026]
MASRLVYRPSYMLTRAGIGEGRIWRVEGASDRMPRNPTDPKAPENRRIEILLQASPG